MKIFYCLALLFVSCASLAFGSPSEQVLAERLRTAKNGDYIVTESNKMITLLAIRSHSPRSLILEEITAPSAALEPRPASWNEWIRNQAPGHTSWSMIEIDLTNHQLLECYSFSRSAWIQLSSQDSIFSTLLSLALRHIPENDRRRIGPAPNDGEADRRLIWQPPLTLEGQNISGAQFEAYGADWPEDGSELAGKKVSLFFDQNHRFPFPFWIQVESAHGAASLRVIDAGKNLPAPHRAMPRRVPEFIGLPQKTENGLRLSLKSPKYYRSFELFAVDVTTREKQIYPVTHTLLSIEGEVMQIEIDRNELRQVLQPEHRYTWLIVPNGYSESYCESRKSFLWKD